MALPTGNKIDMAAEYRRYWSLLQTDETKIKFLLMLKERAYRQQDYISKALLEELATAWLKEPYAP